LGAVVSAAEQLDVAKLPMCLGSQFWCSDPVGHGDRLVQDLGPFAVASPNAVDQSRSERQERLHLQRSILHVLGLGDRLSEKADRGIGSSCVEGADTRFEARQSRGPARRPFAKRAVLLRVCRAEEGVAGVSPQLTPEERDASISLDLGRSSIAARDIGPDQELLGVLVEPVRGDEPARQLRRPGTVTCGELRPRRFPEHALGRSGEASTGCQQPRIEAGAGREGLTRQEVLTKARDADRLHPGACCQGVDVHECAGWQSKDDGFARNARFLAEKFVELGQVPAQGVERIIRLGEQQFGEPLAARR
jgi:hypothetical protein